MGNTNSELFEEMDISQAAIKVMIPTILGSLVMVLYSLADTYFVGLLNNKIQSAAVSLTSPLLISFKIVNNLFGIGASSLMSRGLGKKIIKLLKRVLLLEYMVLLF
ncbi:MATE family efflux transporter [Allocoprobacillus halotolerans]|uniref:MATE family efflux transporter n=1 Tax=Allocoprobacillus halotolerans TaxID=2944914 RepID=A0ABY5I5Q7_9FIRM|nr:MATE family efflux transporter [Allocoprobacillus halotolerans]UTY40315.1 MATE family efflux transporter [Allocoprobacillus halotolerans]